ncbi:MAG TPA: TIGR02391 family protein [Kiloniellales bacterium]|jgi:uncharacterized protein (TIGR02391 family)
MNRKQLIGAYAQLLGIREAISDRRHSNPPADIGLDYNRIVDELKTILQEDTSNFVLGHDGFYGSGSGSRFCRYESLSSKLRQMISYLEKVYFAESEIIEVGTLFNAISDSELRDRCSDLLTAQGKFDRVINQATQVLEDRIRTKSGDQRSKAGVSLINAVLKSDPSETILKVSDDGGEQEGFTNICRGIMQGFRNQTHHRLSDNFSREDALKFCGFVDNLLQIIEKAEVRAQKN